MPFTPATGSRLLVKPGPLSTVVFKALAQTLVTLTGATVWRSDLEPTLQPNDLTHRYGTERTCSEWGVSSCCVVSSQQELTLHSLQVHTVPCLCVFKTQAASSVCASHGWGA